MIDNPSFWQLLMEALEKEGFFYWSELLAVITGIAYVVLAARNNSWCWLWGIISAALWTYAAYVVFDLYVDALLQVFYVVMAVVGWYQWTQGRGYSLAYKSIDEWTTPVDYPGRLRHCIGGWLSFCRLYPGGSHLSGCFYDRIFYSGYFYGGTAEIGKLVVLGHY